MRSALAKSSPTPPEHAPNSFQKPAYWSFWSRRDPRAGRGRAWCSRRDRLDVAVLLQDLSANIERQVVGVDHAAHEAQYAGKIAPRRP